MTRRRPLGATGRLVLALALAFPAVAGVAATQPATAEAAASCVYISAGRFNPPGDDRLNINNEWVLLRNRCASIINIGGWKVRDRAGNVYRFATGTRMGVGLMYLHSGRGVNRPGHRYWGRTVPVWDNTSTERAYLLRANGTTASVWPTSTVAAAPPATGNVGATAFGARPRSGAISLRNCHDLTISNKTFRSLGANVVAIRLENCRNVTINAVDFINVAEGVYALNSTNIRVLNARYSNIVGPSKRDGHNRGNFVQFHNVNGGLISHNKGKGGDTEDVVSLYHTSNVIVEDNRFEGTNWYSTSSSGIALSDGSSSHNIARRNILVNIGQVGIFIAGGVGNQILNNVIYGEPRVHSNVGIYVWNQSGSACSGAVVSGNKVYLRKASGVVSGYWSGGGCGSVKVTGNSFSAPFSPTPYRVAF